MPDFDQDPCQAPLEMSLFLARSAGAKACFNQDYRGLGNILIRRNLNKAGLGACPHVSNLQPRIYKEVRRHGSRMSFRLMQIRSDEAESASLSAWSLG